MLASCSLKQKSHPTPIQEASHKTTEKLHSMPKSKYADINIQLLEILITFLSNILQFCFYLPNS